MTTSKNTVDYSTVPQGVVSEDVLKEKYLKGEETKIEEVFARVAREMASVEKPEDQKRVEEMFYQNMLDGAIGAGRIMSSGGTDLRATLINCFTQPVGDSITGYDQDGLPGIYTALEKAAETMRMGGGVGYNFSNIRPRGAWIGTTKTEASGPCSYMDVFNASCSTVEAKGSRRGAQMGMLNIDHPDIMEFITAKREPGRWSNFNVSVAVTEEFMKAVKEDAYWELAHKARPHPDLKLDTYQLSDGRWVYKTIKAREIWGTIMENTYNHAEPGIIFVDKINKDNPLYYVERIDCTNPCGEQPLPPYGCCDLGPIILPFLVKNPFGFAGTPSFDFDKLKKMVTIQVRFLDNVLDTTYWPLKEQKEEAMNKRRIGIGYTGLGNCLAMMKLGYNTEEGRQLASDIARIMRDAAYEASSDLAVEKGSFPLFDAEKYLASEFVSRLPESIREKIRTQGMRNSHLLSIAPTGTVSLAFANNASNGIEPPFSWTYNRNKRQKDGSILTFAVEDYSYKLFRSLFGENAELPEYMITALEMSAKDHMEMMVVTQPYIDSAISKTVNIPADYPFEDFKDLYMQAFEGGLKGLATYRPNSILGAVLEVAPEKKDEPAKETPAKVDLDTIRIERRPNGTLRSLNKKVECTAAGQLFAFYLNVGFVEVRDGDQVGHRAIEFFLKNIEGDLDAQWVEAAMRGLSLAARGGELSRALRDLKKVRWNNGNVRYGWIDHIEGYKVPRFHSSLVATVAFVIEEIIEEFKKLDLKTVEVVAEDVREVQVPVFEHGRECPECKAHAVVKRDGCEKCTNCGMMGSCG